MTEQHTTLQLNMLPTYIGRQKQKELLRECSHQVINEPCCRVLYFDAAGGLGKTRMLSLYPEIILTEYPDDAETLNRLRVARIVDFYHYESRDPNIIEEHLINGLKQETPDETTRIPAAQVEVIFQPYEDASEAYRRTQEIGGGAAEIEQLRATFVECWNRMAEQFPLVMCFDTLETLFSKPAPPEALVNIGRTSAGVELVEGWFRRVLPHLRHTLVLLSGRPVSGNRIIRCLQELDLLAAPVQTLNPFDSPPDIRSYLSAYGYREAGNELLYVRQITEGRPLLLTCYAEARRSNTAVIPGLPDLPPSDQCSSRPEFEDWLLGTLLNPLWVASDSPENLRQRTLIYCLYFLMYARRGLHASHIKGLFLHLDIPHDETIIEMLGSVALIKPIGDYFFLHDEIFVMIDESAVPDQCGLRQPTLDYLCDISRENVQKASDSTARLRAMADHMYYELTRTFEQGYRAYSIYVDRLLNERQQNPALVLSDAFWRTLNYAIRQGQEVIYPYQNALLQSSINYTKIRRDEQVNRVQFLLAKGENTEAMELAELLYQQLVQEGVIPADKQPLTRETWPAEPYLFVEFSLARASAHLFARTGVGDTKAEQIFSRIIAFLTDLEEEETDILPDTFLRQRHHYFLGFAYLKRGFLRRQQQRYSDAQDDYVHSRNALKSYRQLPVSDDSLSGETILNDNITADLAQVTNNLSYILVLRGQLKRAMRLSNEVLHEYASEVSPYQKTLFYSTNSRVLLSAGQYEQAEKSVILAEQAARESGNSRAIGAGAKMRGQVQRFQMMQRKVPNPQINSHFERAAELLEKEPDTLREILYDWSGYKRDMALLYRDQGEDEAVSRYHQEALDLLDRALTLLPKMPTMQRVDYLECKSVLHNMVGAYNDADVLLAQADEIMQTIQVPEYGQVLCARIALQWGIIFLYRDQNPQEALTQMAIALTRTYIFGREHQAQQTIEQEVARCLKDISDVFPQELLHFRQDTETEQLYVVADDLPYQKLVTVKWEDAWEYGISFINEHIASLLND